VTNQSKPNQRADRAAWKLGQVLAPRVTTALEHLGRQLAHLDGHPSSTMGDGMPRGGAELTAVERVAEQRWRLTSMREQIRDDLDAVCQLVDALGHSVDTALRGHVAPPPAQAVCSENQMRREGANEWGDATCEASPVKAGLCSACYQRERRWRQGAGLTERVA
jgi:hypothetical protein